MLDILSVHAIQGTFSQAKVMNRVKEVGFSTSIAPYEAIDFVRKLQLALSIILKLIQLDIFQVHLKNVLGF